MYEQLYTDNFDNLVALITHLSSTSFKSRTPSNIAKDLSLDSGEVLSVLEAFPAFFRKSKNKSTDQEHYFTVHLRYARRKQENEDGEKSKPLEPEELGSLIDLVTHMVAQEQETSRLYLDLKERYRNLFWSNIVTMAAAIIAALAAISSASGATIS